MGVTGIYVVCLPSINTHANIVGFGDRAKRLESFDLRNRLEIAVVDSP